MNDKNDPEHGFTAAEWFLKNRKLFDVSSRDAKEIYYAVRYHNIPEKYIPKEIDLKYKRSINLLKCADALDRFRLPKVKWWLNEDYLKIKPPEQLINFAKYLIIETEKYCLKGNKIKRLINYLKSIGIIF